MRNHTHSLLSLLGAFGLTIAATIATPGRADAAEGVARGAGVGATQTLAGVSGATFVYDAGSFHITGLLGFESVDQPEPVDESSRLALGAQFLYHVSTTAHSDFGLGGGVTIVNFDGAGDETNIDIELLGQIRAFIVPNVALSASLGLLIVTVDDGSLTDGIIQDRGGTSFAFGGHVLGAAGVTYFF